MVCRKVRYLILMMMFLTTFVAYVPRSNMSVNIITMARIKQANSTHAGPQCQARGALAAKTERKDFAWTETEQGLVLGAYMWGYVLFCLPGGALAEWFGPWNTVLISNAVVMVFNSLTPPATVWLNYCGAIACRFVIGMMGATVYPALNVMMARWAPPEEKGLFMSAMLGNTLGTVVTWVTIGLVVDTLDLGWPWGFHVLTFLIGAYQLLWALIVTDRPETHRFITVEERNHIVEAQMGHVSNRKVMAPYLRIVTNVHVWAMVVAQFGNLWILYLLQTLLPKYMKQVQNFNLKNSTTLASAPYVTRFISAIIFGTVGDYIKRHRFCSNTALRKGTIFFSHLVPAVCCILIPLAKCNAVLAVGLLCVNQFFNAAVVIGHLVNCQDLSPNFAGTLYGLHSFIGGTTGFIVPQLNSFFTNDDPGSVEAWAPTFYIAGIVCAVCGVFFIIFGSGEVQPFNVIKEDAE